MEDEGLAMLAGLYAELAAVVIPDEPGLYVDREGAAWMLTDDGCWVDAVGAWRPPEFKWMLVYCAPLTRVE